MPSHNAIADVDRRIIVAEKFRNPQRLICGPDTARKAAMTTAAIVCLAIGLVAMVAAVVAVKIAAVMQAAVADVDWEIAVVCIAVLAIAVACQAEIAAPTLVAAVADVT